MHLTEHSVNQQYSNYIQPLNQDLFGIINERLIQFQKDWSSKKILDFGCNNGNLLLTSEGQISNENYYGVDIQESALHVGIEKFPETNWIHYDRYHPAFNANGKKDVFPQLVVTPDIIVCHGVFTHCDMTTIIETIKYFKSIISQGGLIVFSMWEQEHLRKYTDIFLRNSLNVHIPDTAIMPFVDSLYLIDRTFSIVDQPVLEIEQCTWIETFYSRDYILQCLPDIKIPQGRQTKHTIFVIEI
jgi:2-polyprenyl-3-methyl-5-hydroxy-6-metoxy-1,4-benzoquinol methylase